MLTFWPHTLRLLRPLGTYWRSVLTAHTDTTGLSAARSALFSSLPPCESIIVTGAEVIKAGFGIPFFAGSTRSSAIVVQTNAQASRRVGVNEADARIKAHRRKLMARTRVFA